MIREKERERERDKELWNKRLLLRLEKFCIIRLLL